MSNPAPARDRTPAADLADADRARDALALRQRAVLSDLLAGRTPHGFDAAQCAMTSRVLLNKRSSAAASVCRQLRLLPNWRRRFASYARAAGEPGCAHEDLAGFRRWLQATPDQAGDPVVAGWLRLDALYDGRRRGCWAVHSGYWSIVLGLGTRVWHLHIGPAGTNGRKRS